MVNKCTDEIGAQNKSCNQNLNYQICSWLLCEQIVNAVDTPAEEYKTN